ncbi:protein MAIN-LIKE 2-like [Solanum stenotomum]|uniref:protein MAIN-LIKE 2-like n=1 Tax=Solanum stenotomum TaxID=172797 RepID=UPI0020D01B16|nr:protein MAIN-LIKE 2-like [Solanum stenotomum]
MERVVNPGPIDRTLLLSQHEHKSKLLWKRCSMTVPLLQLWLSVEGQRLIASTYLLDATRRIRPWRTLLETLTGCAIAPADLDGASRVRIHSITGYLQDQLQVDPIGDATPVERVEKISRLYMLVILGGVLFLNTLGNLIILQYLAFLDPIHDVGKYSWGSAVLAYLYRALCRAFIGNVVDICEFIPLLQVTLLKF